jgi:hypothetical protein
MEISPEHDRDFVILEHIEKDPDANQATLAALLGIAIGTVNWSVRNCATLSPRKELPCAHV